jgi:hypothetical protein
MTEQAILPAVLEGEILSFHEPKGEAQIRETLEALQKEILSVLERLGIEQIDLPLKHTFATGVYMREIFLPKGTIVVGKIHRHDHVNFISYGDVTVLTKDGRQRLVGPITMVSTAGTKRAVFVHEDTVWTTIHANPTNETDLEKLEEFIIAKNYAEFPLIEDKS